MHSNVKKLASLVLLLGIVGWFEIFGTALSASLACNADDSDLGPLVAPNSQAVNRFISTRCGFADKWSFSLDKAAQTAIGVQGVDFDFGFGDTRIDNLLFALLDQGGTEIASRGGGASIIERLDAGTYTLQISGDVVGSIGGQYSGALTLANVPLPPAILLFVTGLSGFVLVSRRRPWGNAPKVLAR